MKELYNKFKQTEEYQTTPKALLLLAGLSIVGVVVRIIVDILYKIF